MSIFSRRREVVGVVTPDQTHSQTAIKARDATLKTSQPRRTVPVAAPARVVATGVSGESKGTSYIARILNEDPESEDAQRIRAKLASRAAHEPLQKTRIMGPVYPTSPSDCDPRGLLSNLSTAPATLSAEIWTLVVDLLDPVDAANLARSSKLFRYRLGAEPWSRLALSEFRQERISFLLPMDIDLPRHLFCFPCATYHYRTDPDQEQLYASYIEHPVFDCSNALHRPLPRTRMAHGRDLPFYLVQLAMRASRFTPEYGMPLSKLARSWKCKDSDWSHRSRFHTHKGHLLMRVTSTVFAAAAHTPSEQRLLLFSRSEYMPYFSVCSHWQDGSLMPATKCALTHIPGMGQSLAEQMRREPGKVPSWKLRTTNLMARQCEECAVLRRCPQCPSEYLVEVKLTEDPRDKINRFKHALCVTRWSDLGDGISPTSAEWKAVNGLGEYDSLGAVGNATLCSQFEAAINNGAPNQRVKSLGMEAWRAGDVY